MDPTAPARILFLLFGAVLFFHYYRFGATQIDVRYGFFLSLAAVTALGLWLLPLGNLGTAKSLPFLASGFILLLQIAWRGPVTGNGYVHAWLGWSALFLTLLLLQSGIRDRSFVFLLIALGIFEALYGLLQAVGGYDQIGGYFRGLGRTASGTLINRNHFAAVLNVTIALAMGALYAAYLRKQRFPYSASELTSQVWIILLGLAAMGLAVVCSLSRAGVLTLIATQALMGFLLFLSWSRETRRGGRLFPVASVALLLLVALYGLGVGLAPLLERFQGSETTWAARVQLYRDTLDLVEEHPITGVGPGLYRWKIPPYLSGTTNTYHHAHNDYLEHAAEWGIPIALGFWTFVLWRFYRCGRRFLLSQHSWPRGLALGCTAALFALLLHSLVDLNLQVPANWVLLCILLGLSFSSPPGSRSPATPVAGPLVDKLHANNPGRP